MCTDGVSGSDVEDEKLMKMVKIVLFNNFCDGLI